MTDNVNIKFQIPVNLLKGQLRASIIFLPLITFTIIVFLTNIYRKYRTIDTMELVLFCILMIVCVNGLYLQIVFIRRLYTTASSVTLTDDRIIGNNLRRPIVEIKYIDIEQIIKHNKFNTIVVISPNVSLELSSDIDDYGTYIERIRERAVNVKKVDYGGLDKKDKIWLKK